MRSGAMEALAQGICAREHLPYELAIEWIQFVSENRAFGKVFMVELTNANELGVLALVSTARGTSALANAGEYPIGHWTFMEAFFLPGFSMHEHCVWFEHQYQNLGTVGDVFRAWNLQRYLVHVPGMDQEAPLRQAFVELGATVWVEWLCGWSFMTFRGIDLVKKVCRAGQPIPTIGRWFTVFDKVVPFERSCMDYPTDALYNVCRQYHGWKVFDDAHVTPQVVLRDVPRNEVHPYVIELLDTVGIDAMMNPRYCQVRLEGGMTVQRYLEMLVARASIKRELPDLEERERLRQYGLRQRSLM